MNNRVLISAMCLALPFALVARTISVTASDRQGCVKILFGQAESSATNYLYVAYGPTDGGSDPKNWANFVCEEDVPPEMTETECALPSGWGVSVKAVRYFLTKERFDYAVAYDYIQLNASSAKVGAYFETDYMPKGNTHVVSDYTPQEKGRTTTVFCSRGTSSSAKSYTLFYFSNYFRFDCGNTVVQT